MHWGRTTVLGTVLAAFSAPLATPEIALLLWEKDRAADRDVFPIRQPNWGVVGFIDRDGREIEFPRGARSFRSDFHEGLAVAGGGSGAGLEGFITRTGEWAIPAQYSHAEPFSEGLAAVERDGKWGYVDRAGETAVAPVYDEARPFQDGRAAVRLDDKWGYIDDAGEYVVSPTFERVSNFSEGRAWVIRDPGPCWIPARFPWDLREIVGPSSTGRTRTEAMFEIPNCRYTLIDKAGEVVGDRTFDAVRDFSEGLAAVAYYNEGGAHWGYIDRDARFAISPAFEAADSFSEGMAPAVPLGSDGTGFGYIDRAGRFVIPPRFDSARPFFDGRAAVEKSSDAGDVERFYINLTGERAFDGIYFAHSDFVGGLAQVVPLEGRDGWAYIDRDGRVVYRYSRWTLP